MGKGRSISYVAMIYSQAAISLGVGSEIPLRRPGFTSVSVALYQLVHTETERERERKRQTDRQTDRQTES